MFLAQTEAPSMGILHGLDPVQLQQSYGHEKTRHKDKNKPRGALKNSSCFKRSRVQMLEKYNTTEVGLYESRAEPVPEAWKTRRRISREVSDVLNQGSTITSVSSGFFFTLKAPRGTKCDL